MGYLNCKSTRRAPAGDRLPAAFRAARCAYPLTTASKLASASRPASASVPVTGVPWKTNSSADAPAALSFVLRLATSSPGATVIVTVCFLAPESESTGVIHGFSGSEGYDGGRRFRSESRDFFGRLDAWCFVAFFWTWCAIETAAARPPTARGADAGASTSPADACSASSSSKHRSIFAVGEEDEGGGEEEGDDAPLDARFDELAHLVGKRVEVQMEDTRGVPRWFAGKARSATRRRGLQVSFDDGERKAFHADEINDASQGTFWRFE